MRIQLLVEKLVEQYVDLGATHWSNSKVTVRIQIKSKHLPVHLAYWIQPEAKMEFSDHIG